jgi:hypothetical protein
VLPDEINKDTIPAIDAGREEDLPAGPPELPNALIDELLAGARTAEEVTGPGGLLQQLTQQLRPSGRPPSGSSTT